MGQQIKMVQPEKRNVMNPPWAWCPKCWVQTERDENGECIPCKTKNSNKRLSGNSYTTNN